MSLEDRFYCIEGVLLSECPLKKVLLYRGCPLLRVSLEDRFYCIEGVLSSRVSLEDRFYCIEGVLSLECPLKTGFTV